MPPNPPQHTCADSVAERQTEIGVEPLWDAPIKFRSRIRWRFAIASLIIIVLGFGLWRHVRSATLAASGQPAVVAISVPVELPEKEPITQQILLTGQFSAVNQTVLKAQVSGYLQEIHFQDGQLVHRGDLLFVIDPRPYQVILEQSVAALHSAQGTLIFANKEVGRLRSLQGSGAVTVEQLDERVQQQTSAQSAIEAANAAIDAAKLNLEFTRITAPFDGRIGMRLVSLGSLISGGSSAGSLTPLATIVSIDPIYFDFDMSQSDYIAYHKHNVGRQSAPQVLISLDGETPWSRKGALQFLDNEIDRGSGTLHARATLMNPDFGIEPGEFANVKVPVSAPTPELLVPDTSLAMDQSNWVVIVVQKDGLVEPREVDVGAPEDDGMRVIMGGLKPDDQVVVDGLMLVHPGMKVSPRLQSNSTATAD